MSFIDKLKSVLGRSRGAPELEQTYSKQVVHAEAEREREERAPEPSRPPEPPTERSS